jgi:hypothetical protein
MYDQNSEEVIQARRLARTGEGGGSLLTRFSVEDPRLSRLKQ